MADGFYSTDWDNQGQGQGQNNQGYDNQAYSNTYDPNAYQQQQAYGQQAGGYDQFASQPAAFGGDMYQPGNCLFFF
jgi:hypothetical protein